MSYVQYVCDVETTGKNPELHDVIEVCFWRLDEPESKTWWLKPLRPQNIEDEALAVNKHKREDILHQTQEGREKYLDPKDILPELEMWFMRDGAAAEDRAFIGQNPNFDYSFLLKLWELAGNLDNFPFGYWIPEGKSKRNQGFIIDTIEFARIIDLATDKRRDRYGLGALVKAFGITKAQAHRADGDVKMTKDLFQKMFEPIKTSLIDAFDNAY